MKGNIHILVDPNTYKEFMAIVGRGNLTRTIEQFMLNTIAVNNKDTKGIDIKLLNNDLERLKRKLSKIQAELTQKQKLKEKYEEEHRKAEELALIEEKERIEAKHKCIQCGRIINEAEKIHKFPKGSVCSGCFMAADSSNIKRWSE